jgi:hypothetical protein
MVTNIQRTVKGCPEMQDSSAEQEGFQCGKMQCEKNAETSWRKAFGQTL